MITETREKEWEIFSKLVKEHIQKYANKQYGDKGEDEVTRY